jgi:hypothetical protein
MKTYFAWTVVLLEIIFVIQAAATDCSVSKEFRIKHPQVLAGVLQDPNDATLPGIGLELLSGGKVVQHLRTNNQGAYDFGMVPAGKYRIHVEYSDNAFCAPKVQCGDQGCRLDSKMTINPKKEVLVR